MQGFQYRLIKHSSREGLFRSHYGSFSLLYWSNYPVATVSSRGLRSSYIPNARAHDRQAVIRNAVLVERLRAQGLSWRVYSQAARLELGTVYRAAGGRSTVPFVSSRSI